jgi:hypothetical protein
MDGWDCGRTAVDLVQRPLAPTAADGAIGPYTVRRADRHDRRPGGMDERVNVWRNRLTRGAVMARLRPGDRVVLLQHTGYGARIETADGTRGWVRDVVIKELQDTPREQGEFVE